MTATTQHAIAVINSPTHRAIPTSLKLFTYPSKNSKVAHVNNNQEITKPLKCKHIDIQFSKMSFQSSLVITMYQFYSFFEISLIAKLQSIE